MEKLDNSAASGRALLDKPNVYEREQFRHDPQFRGPLSKRSCTDVICLLIFFVFLIAFGFAGYFAFREGDIDKILVPRDSKGFQCGRDSEVLDKKYLLFFDLVKCADPLVPIQGCQTTQICVEKCPNSTFVFDRSMCRSSDVSEIRKSLICLKEIDVNSITTCDAIQKHIDEEKCAKWYMKSEPLGNLCLPTSIDDAVKTIEKSDVVQALQNLQIIGSINGMGQLIVEDTIHVWPMLAVGLALSAVCSLLIIAIMRWVAGPIVWASIIGILGLLGTGVYYSYRQWMYFNNNPVDRYNLQPNLKSLVNSYFVKADTWLYILIASSITLTIILLFVILFRKRIVIAIALIKEGSKAVSGNITTVFFPIIPWIVQAAVIILSICMFVNLASVGEPEHIVIRMKNDTSCQCTGNYSTITDGDLCDPKLFNLQCGSRAGGACMASCMYTGLKAESFVQYFKIINVFGFFWLVFFISAFGEMVLAGVFARWYWTLNKREDVPFFILTGSIYRTLRFHLGTLAFGSFIITLCRIIRLLLEYVDRKAKKVNNECTRAVMCCCKCFFWLLETFLKFLNKNAYIMCAIHGKSFLPSSKDAFNLLMRNVLRVIAVDKTTDILFFISKLLISFGMAACTFTYITSDLFNQHFPNVLLHQPIAQVVFIFIGSYFISTIFFGVYSMAVDTLFLCFLEDCERNDGSPDRPFFMSKQLRKILGKSNK